MNTFPDFLAWEAASRDTIDFKKVYVDMTGDLAAGLMLSEILYWYLPAKDGTPNKLAVKHADKEWIAVHRYDWWDRTRLSPKEADRALTILVKLGVVEKSLFKFDGDPTVHIRLLHETFLRCLNVAIMAPLENPFLPKVKNEIPQRSKTLLTKGEIPVTETTTETTTSKPQRAREIPQVEKPTVLEKPKPVQPAVSWTSAVNDVWGYNDWLNAETARMLQGNSTERGFAKFNVKPALQSPAELLEWSAWYRKVKLGGKNLNMVEDRAKIQSSISEWRGERERLAEKARREKEQQDQYVGVPFAVDHFKAYAAARQQ